MISFFRKIRQKLFSSPPAGKEGNRVTRYFVYAVGEIFLVVTGILIALQVNNWNTNIQNQKKESAILIELKEGLKADKELLQKKLEQYLQDQKQLLILDSLLKIDNHPYTQSMNSLFGKVYGIRFTRVNKAFYEDLKSSGLQIIRDKKIRSQIVGLFENNYNFLEGILEIETSIHLVLRPYYLSNFTEIEFNDSANPINYEKVWSDPYYKNIVHYRIISLEGNQLREYQKAIAAIEGISIDIEEYLSYD